MKQHKAMIVALIVICITAVVAALVTRKDLCEVHIRTAAAGGVPCHVSGARVSSTHPNFTQACPRAGFWGG
ncbi:hypothetical protein WQ93_10785 [Escherichia coli]|nr:hypothetical protein WQ93_10785 [Escherichia coli]